MSVDDLTVCLCVSVDDQFDCVSVDDLSVCVCVDDMTVYL